MDKSNAPFVAGQRIIRTGPSNEYVKNGETYTCEECFKCPSCGSWKVTIKEIPTGYFSDFHCSCGAVAKITNFMGGLASLFAPLQYSSISHQLANEAMQSDKAVEVDIVQPVKELS